MASIGSLVVNIAGDNSKLDKALKDSSQAVSKWGTTFTALKGAATGAFVAIGAAVGTVSVAVYGLQSRIAKLAETADKAAQTGLSGEFLQRLEYAADQSGVSVDVLAASAKKMTVLIGQAASGSALAEKSLAKLGLTTASLVAMSPEQQFAAIADKIGQLPTAAERAAAAMAIFGKSGVAMTGLLSGGMDGVNALLKEAADLGIGISEEDLALAAAADDAIQRMSMSFGALFDKLAVTFSPLLTDISNQITGLIAPLNHFMDRFNMLPDKAAFVSQALQAAFDVAFEYVMARWDKMLDELIAKAKAKMPSAGTIVSAALGGGLGISAGIKSTATGPSGEEKLKAAQERFTALLASMPQRAEQAAAATPPPSATGGGGALATAATDLFASLKSKAETAAGVVAGKAKMAQGQLTGTLDRWFNDPGWKNATKAAATDTATSTPGQPQQAGALQRGSAEALQAILTAMGGGAKDGVEETNKLLLKSLQQQAKDAERTRNVIANTKPGFLPEFA